jgi:ATP-dependent Clp protease ATP-binding subunit ClpC
MKNRTIDIVRSLEELEMFDLDIQRIRSLCNHLMESAAAEARSLQHPYLGVEHLFIAMTRIQGGETERLLLSVGLDVARAREEIRREIGKGKSSSSMFPPFTPRLEKIAKIAEKQAVFKNPILERNFLTALLEEDENIIARYFYSLGLDCGAYNELLSGVSAELTCFSPSIDPDGTVLNIEGFIPSSLLPDNDKPSIQPGPSITPLLDIPTSLPTPILDKYGRDLTKMARMGKLSEAVSREAELEQIITILARTQKANPILLGESGVGKTAIIEGLAWNIVNGSIPDVMKGKRIVQIDMGDITADTELRGQFERRVKQMIKEASEAPDVIMFIDEIHTIVGAGQGMHSALDAAQMFKPALSRGDFSCIGATTQNDYFHYIRRDPALERRFSPVIIRELTSEVTLTILEKAVERILEKQAKAGHVLTLAPDVLITALKLTDQYIRDRNQPDKSIDAIDLACAKAVVRGINTVTADDTASVVSEWTGIPVSRMTSDEKQRYAKMEEFLNTKIIGQKYAISAISQAIRSGLAGMKAPHRPMGVFLFLGPTGVGKTKLAKEIATFLFQSPQALLRFDMNEYKEAHTVSNLIGSSRGYVGSDQGGLLSESLRKRPYSVILLDEIDKAHPDILDLFLSIFDDGRITDNQGRLVDCSNALFIMTSNYGIVGDKIGFCLPSQIETSFSKSEDLRKKASDFMRPELVNRITEVIEFPQLLRNDFKEILGIVLKERLQEFGSTQQNKIDLEVDELAKELILDLGYDPRMGARSLERAIDQILIHPFVDIMYTSQNQATNYKATAIDGQIVFIPSEEVFEDEDYESEDYENEDYESENYEDEEEK